MTGEGASHGVSVYERTLLWAERTRVPFATGSPRIRPRNVLKRLAGPQTELRCRAPRPRSRSRTRTGGAASAAVLVMIGTGTVGAFPAANATVHGRVVDHGGHRVDAVPVRRRGRTRRPSRQSRRGPPADQATFEQGPAEFTTALPDQRAQVAIRTAMAQLGLPYVWGGDGPTNGDAGFDCSGLTTFSYAAAGVSLPRTAHTQYYTGPHVPQGAALQPGDLVFYGTPATVHHVGMYLGDGKMVNAPTFGKPVQTAFYRWTGDDYLGATRPAATGPTTSGLLPYAPAAPSTGAPETSRRPPRRRPRRCRTPPRRSRRRP